MGKFLVTGIDIGHYSIKAVVLTSADQHRSLVTYKELPVIGGIFTDNQTLDYQKLVKKLRELKKMLPVFIRNAAISLPDNAVISKTFSFDVIPEIREEEFMVYQAFSQQSHIPADELCLDFIDVTDKDSVQKTGRTYQVYATRKAMMEGRVASIKRAGFRPVLADMQSHCLQTVCEYAGEKQERQGNWMLVNIGLMHTSFCVVSASGQLFYREIALDSILHSDSDDNLFISGEATDFLNELSQKIEKHVRLYHTVSSPQTLDGIWFSGSDVGCNDLCLRTEKLLGIRCELLNPLELVDRGFFPRGNNGSELAFCCATGLAIRGIEWMEERYGA